MKWVTRESAKTDRVACPWLITRFIDPEAEFNFVARDQVLPAAARLSGKSFDARARIAPIAEIGARSRSS